MRSSSCVAWSTIRVHSPRLNVSDSESPSPHSFARRFHSVLRSHPAGLVREGGGRTTRSATARQRAEGDRRRDDDRCANARAPRGRSRDESSGDATRLTVPPRTPR
eukprot:8493-Pelagococcus_subviridis.AAC.5